MNTEEAIQAIRDGNFKTGWAFINRFRTNRTLSREELVRARNALSDALIDSEAKVAHLKSVQYANEHILEELKLQTEMRLAHHMLELTAVQANTQLTKEALSRGVTLPNYQTMQMRQHDTDQKRQIDRNALANRLIEAKVKSAISMEEEQRRTELRLMEKQGYNELEIEMELRKALNTLAVITKFKHLHFNEFDEVRSRINSLLEEGHQIEMSSLPIHVKGAQLNVLREAIVAYEEIFHAQKSRLMGIGNREEVEGVRALGAFHGGDSGEGEQATEERFSSEESGSGPRW
jgi:hypothetical protein